VDKGEQKKEVAQANTEKKGRNLLASEKGT